MPRGGRGGTLNADNRPSVNLHLTTGNLAAEPYFEYGVKFLPRRNDIITHGSLERAKAALIDAPILLASGDYGIVRRLIHEPGDWEIVPDVTFDQADAA